MASMSSSMFNEVRKNKFRTILIFIMFFLLLSFLGSIIGLYFGNIYSTLILTFIFGAIYSSIVWFSGSNMILALSGAIPVTKQNYPHYYHSVESLCIAGGLKTIPKCYVIKDTALNAFATGRDPENSAICVTTGLLDKLNRQELEGVLAHELSHIINYDIRVMMLAAVLVGVITMLSDFFLRSLFWGSVGGGNRRDNEGGQSQIIFLILGIVMAILAPLIAQLIKLAISRRREYVADANAAILTRYPQGLADALRKIKSDPDPLVDKANKGTAHLFISSPFRKKSSAWTNMFSTHPPIDERIKRLEAM